MSFYSNFQSDKCPGAIGGNALNGLNEKVCIQAQKIFDACIKQIQLENYTLTLDDDTLQSVTAPLTFISARSISSVGEIESLSVERQLDKSGCSRVQAKIKIPVEVLYSDNSGGEHSAESYIEISEDVILSVPAPSIMPYKITAEVSAVCAEGTYVKKGKFSVNACVTAILKVALDVELLIPTYGYTLIPPAQDYSKEVCAGFLELPLYPKSNSCPKQPK
jgi:hypothetical protein